MSKENTASVTMNRAKPYQLVLFPFNNGATNVYYILTSSYIAYYGGVLGLLTGKSRTVAASSCWKRRDKGLYRPYL